MTLVGKVEKWLRNNTDLKWEKASGDKEDREVDKEFLHRQEGYEIRDLIVEFFELSGISQLDKNIEKIYGAICFYREGEKVKRKDVLSYLKQIFD